ncbi:putative ankyrin repeat-containing domain-containing protein [Plasmopara halstedii]
MKSSKLSSQMTHSFEIEVKTAVKAGDATKLRQLFDNGVNFNAKDEEERTQLYWACATGRLDAAILFLERAHAAVNVQDGHHL